MKKQLKILLSSAIISCTLLTGTAIINPTILSNQIVSTAEAISFWNEDRNFPCVLGSFDYPVYLDASSCCIANEDEHARTIAFNLITVNNNDNSYSVETCYVRGYDATKGYKLGDINKGSWNSLIRAPQYIKNANRLAMDILGIKS